MAEEERPYQPALPWRLASALTIGTVGFLSRSFLFALNRTQVQGLDRFQEILDERKDEQSRERGLITVSNHVSVMVSAFFSLGQTLPTHRTAHSKFGGLFQPTVTECIRLLSDPHGSGRLISHFSAIDRPKHDYDETGFPCSDPFSSAQLTYSTNGLDTFPAPSAYPSRRFSWIHIFPEGMIHQHPDKVMRYFKWGVARLILEAEPCPDVLPMWIDGPQQAMDNERGWPRALPRVWKDITIHFGTPIDRETILEPFRERWRELKDRARRQSIKLREGSSAGVQEDEFGDLTDDELKFGKEAEQLRIDVTLAVRDEVMKVRRSCGLPDEDPKRSLADSYREEGTFGRDGLKKDGSTIKDA